ncbi:MAG: hypothetical protein EZS28_022818 [Streblomastix strix]|uniref:Uncharacterized protein n=1 Tax=Streblomastix strix TaxID=222440 RepID=A0A5J4VGU8_9EUKA|nr:MAG: hypothetical protein EZS28_022818 [Streblomastix strix]
MYPWATTYLFKHVASTELAKQGLDTTKLNFFTHRRINDIASQLMRSHGQSYATQTISQQRGGAIERSDISTLPECYLQHSGNSMLTRSSIVQPLVHPFYETLPVGQGIEPTDNTRARSDTIYFDHHENDDMSRQQYQQSSYNANELEL